MATIVTGTAIRPVVSANKRRYTTDTLTKAHDRLSARLADSNGKPVTMRLFHPKPGGQDASVAAIAGHLTKVSRTAEGGIAYEAVLADTEAGRTAAALATPDASGKQHLANVSIRAYALGDLPTDNEGNSVPGDLEIFGLDLTDDPGVDGATVSAAAESRTDESDSRHLLYESVEALVITDQTEAAKPKPVTPGAGDYADPGYQTDKKPRYPVDTKAHALAAWAYISKASNQKPYTPAQLGRIKGKIKAACKKFGVSVSEAAYKGAALHEAVMAALVDEAYASVSATNGPTSTSLNTYGADPSVLKDLIAAHAKAAGAALDSLDPDSDGDVDGVTDADPSTCSACGTDLPDDASYCPACGTSCETNPEAPNHEATASDKKEPAVAEETVTEAAKAAEEKKKADEAKAAADAAEAAKNAPVALTETAIVELVAKTVAASLASARAEEAKVADANQKVIDEAAAKSAAEETAKAALRAEVRREVLAEMRSGALPGSPARKGVVRKIDEATDLSTLSQAERNEVLSDSLVTLFPQLNGRG